MGRSTSKPSKRFWDKTLRMIKNGSDSPGQANATPSASLKHLPPQRLHLSRKNRSTGTPAKTFSSKATTSPTTPWRGSLMSGCRCTDHQAAPETSSGTCTTPSSGGRCSEIRGRFVEDRLRHVIADHVGNGCAEFQVVGPRWEPVAALGELFHGFVQIEPCDRPEAEGVAPPRRRR